MNKNDSIQFNDSSTVRDDDKPILECASAPLAIFGFVFYALVFCLGLSGNIFVIATIYRKSSLHTPFNHLVVNLAISDVCVFLFSLPVVVFSECFPWPLGELACRLSRALFLNFTGVSVCTMMVMSFERYRVVVTPLATKMTPKGALLVIVLIWILAILFFGLPKSFLFGLTTNKGILQCDSVVKEKILDIVVDIWGIFTTLLSPGIVVCCAYTRVMRKLRHELDAIGNAYASHDVARLRVKRNAKMMRLLVTIIMVFVVCYLPLNLAFIVDNLSPAYKDWPYNETVESLSRMFQVAHSCFNPIILCLLSRDFRQALTQRVRQSFKRSKKVYTLPKIHQNNNSTSSKRDSLETRL